METQFIINIFLPCIQNDMSVLGMSSIREDCRVPITKWNNQSVNQTTYTNIHF